MSEEKRKIVEGRTNIFAMYGGTVMIGFAVIMVAFATIMVYPALSTDCANDCANSSNIPLCFQIVAQLQTMFNRLLVFAGVCLMVGVLLLMSG